MNRIDIASVEKHLQKLKKLNRWKKIVAIGCCIVLVVTISALTLPAISQSDETFCGIEEHRHKDSCYKVELVCDFAKEDASDSSSGESSLNTESVPEDSAEESTEAEATTAEAHEHTEDCYKKTLICSIMEHIHSNECLSDNSADIETEADWIKTFAKVNLTEDAGKDLLDIAKTQFRYKESQKHFSIGEDGVTKNGYTRYGEWYGEPYADWNMLFVAFCANYAKLESVPQSKDCMQWLRVLKDESSKYYFEFGNTLPKPGDIVFFDTDSDGEIDRAGIVEEMDTIKKEFSVVEGDVDGKVDIVSYSIAQSDAVCYITHPETRKNKQVILEEQKITAAIYTDAGHMTRSEDKTVITVSGKLPKGASAKAHPVILEENFLNGQSLVVAYDITVVDPDGRMFNQTENDNKLLVTIQPPELEKDDNLSVYYVPDRGNPKSMKVIKHKDAIAFETDHFSVYAITRSGTLSTVYLNGQSGNDGNSGTSSAPVKTFGKALELLADEGVIYISGTVTVSGTQTWSLGEGQRIERASSFTDALVKVPSGSELTLKNITINGGADNPSSSNIATNSTYASGKSKAPILVVETGGTANIQEGTILENNSNEPNMSSNKLVVSGYIGMGGAVYSNGTLNMTGGTIRNCEAQCGGGVYIENGTFYLSGGVIDNNYARDIVSYRNRMENYHKNAGGGVYVHGQSKMYMSGGTVSNNQSSREGGGISLGWLNRNNGSAISSYQTYFTMTGGVITENFAVSTGGGLNVTAGCEATISAGYITNNTAEGKEYQDSDEYVNAGTYTQVFTGGGIYIDAQQWDSRGNSSGVPGRCIIHRVIVTDNTADYGGGLASCSTSDTTLGAKINIGDGTAIYGNTADNDDELYLYGGSVSVGSTVLGGGNYNWTKRSYYYKNSLTDTSSAIVKAKELATVYITGNTGYLGGGIGCNGIIAIGTNDEDDVTSISIEKKWVDTVTTHRPDFITVQIYQNGKAYGDPIRIYPTVDSNGNETWPVYYVDDLPAGYTYTISEVTVPGYQSEVSVAGRRYTITNTIQGFMVEKIWLNDTVDDRPESIIVQLYQNSNAYGETTVLNADNSWGYIWLDLPETDANGEKYNYSVREIEVPEGYICTQSGKLNSSGVWEIENTKIATTSISVYKKWADGVAGKENVTVQLMANGKPQGNPVKLDDDNDWFYIWENLPTMTTDGEALTYTVKENKVYGYVSEVEIGTEAPSRTTWTQVSSFSAGETYMLVSSQGALTRKSNGTLEWTDSAPYLAYETTPPTAVLWKYNSSNQLQNMASGYLALRYSNRVYTFYTASSGASITFSNGRIYNRSGSTSRYFTGINSSGYGTTATSSSSATNFTVYAMEEIKTTVGDTHYVVTNTKRNDSLTIWFTKYMTRKNETDAFPVLPGAELALYRWVEGGEVIPGTTYTGELVDEWTSENDLGVNGSAYGVDLTDGIYYLIETKAPNGYAAPSEPIIFEVDVSEGTVTIIQYPGYEDYLPSFSQDGVISGSESLDFSVFNAPLYELPETGGDGTLHLTIGGFLLITAAVIILLYIKCRKEVQLFSDM